MEGIDGNRPPVRIIVKDTGRNTKLKEERKVPGIEFDVCGYLTVCTEFIRIETYELACVAAVHFHARAEVGKGRPNRHASEQIRFEQRTHVNSKSACTFMPDGLLNIFRGYSNRESLSELTRVAQGSCEVTRAEKLAR